MLNIVSNTTQSLYFTLTEKLIGSSSANPTLILLPKQGTTTQSFGLGADSSTNPSRWNIYQFSASLDNGDYDYRVYSGSILLESGYARCVSGSNISNPVFTQSQQRIVFR